MHAVALAISKKLDLDVSGSIKESCLSVLPMTRSLTLDEHSSVAESALGLTDGSLEVLLEALLVSDDSHTSTTTAHGSLDDDGEAILLDEGSGLVIRLDGSWRSGNNWDFCLHGQSPRLGLVSQSVDGLGSGSDKSNTGVLDLFGKLGVLGEETVTKTRQHNPCGQETPTDPGWIMSTPCSRAIRIMSSWAR